ncbi:MAG: hypothetical protein HXS50_03875 [Theionarchaea archaeon]|nr:hypothetical protein [Theionarchaea archaeon]
MDEEDVAIIDVVEGEGTQILFTQQGIWMPRRRVPGTESVPDLTRIMLGSTLDKRRSKVEGLQQIDMYDLVSQSDEMWDLEHRLRPTTINIPYTSVIRCFLARPGRFSRSKLAFDYFDERSLSVVTCEFRITPEGVGKLEGLLGNLIPDRLEVH